MCKSTSRRTGQVRAAPSAAAAVCLLLKHLLVCCTDARLVCLLLLACCTDALLACLLLLACSLTYRSVSVRGEFEDVHLKKEVGAAEGNAAAAAAAKGDDDAGAACVRQQGVAGCCRVCEAAGVAGCCSCA